MIGQWTQCQRTRGCVMNAGHQGACSITLIGAAGASPPDPRDAEIASLRADVARLTEERDRDLADMRRFQQDVIRLTQDLAASRALADRLAEAGTTVAQELSTAREAFMGGPNLDIEDPEGALALAEWNAALREWEKARRG